MLSEVRYQEEALRFLEGLVAQRITNPLLLVGPDGTGKRFAATQAVRELFCSGSRGSDCHCVNCLQLSQSMHPDLTLLSGVDGKDIGIEAVRGALNDLNVYPSQADVKVVLVDGADRLTGAAANALLKTLEEPPHTARILLLAESLNHVLPTIRSRCGVLNFRPLPENFIFETLQKFESDHTKALVLARLGEGSVGRAIQYWGSGRMALRDKAFSLLQKARTTDIAGIFLLIDEVEKDLPLMLRFLSLIVHDLLMLEVDQQRLVNLDKVEALKTAGRAPQGGWQTLYRELDALLRTSENITIQLGFHAKTLLVQSFVGA